MSSQRTRASPVPSLYPSHEQFKDPITYLSSPDISKIGVKYGMVKIIPPLDFKPPLSINKTKFRFVPRIQKLKELNLLTRCRLFFFKQLLHYNKMNGLPLPKDIFEEVESGGKVHYYDVFIAVVSLMKKRDGVIGKGLPNISHFEIERNYPLWNEVSQKLSVHLSSLQKIYNCKLRGYFDFLSTKSEFTNTILEEKYPTSLLYESSESETDDENHEEEEEEEEACLICKKNTDPSNTLLCDSCDKPYHRFCLSPPLSKVPKDLWFCDNCLIGNGHYGFKDASMEYSLEDFRDLSNDFDKNFFGEVGKPSIEDLEDIFWDLVNSTDNDIKVHYGADIHHSRKGEVSGFPTQDYIPKHNLSREQYREYVKHPMNLNNLPYDPKSLLNFLNVDISGMTIPWIYIGNTFSTFCWHVEDQYTLSANYQHYGATKKWYSIPSSSATKFEQFMQSLAPDLFTKQPDILHQLITLVSPFKLLENGIECYTANQEPGEFIVTYPRVYHAGFNAGYNFNEAVNFTMTDWLDYGIISTQNYKQSVNKASVFDIWEMMINVLKQYTQSTDMTNVDLKLVKMAIERLKPKLNEEYQLRDTIEDFLMTKPITQEKKTTGVSFVKTEQEKEWEEDGVTCSKCHGFCTFFYTKHFKPHRSTDSTNSTNSASSYLITPQSTPSEPNDSNKRRSKRIKVKQDTETFDIEILCLDDYLKLQSRNTIDELYILKDIDEVKELIRKAEGKAIASVN